MSAKKNPEYNALHADHLDEKRTDEHDNDDGSAKERNGSKTLDGIRCAMCGQIFDDDVDISRLMNIDAGPVHSMVRKCFPTTPIRHCTESPQICFGCSQLLRHFSELIDKVMAYQRELQIKQNHLNEEASSEMRFSGGRPVASGCKEVSSSHGIVIKQEPVNVKQETVETSNKRSAPQPEPEPAPSVFTAYQPKPVIPTNVSTIPNNMTNNVETNVALSRGPGGVSWFCAVCDRIFVNQNELESHMCRPAKDRSRNNDNSANNNCEIMEIITLNNSVSFIDLADEEYVPLNGALKQEHVTDMERTMWRERVEYDHPYAKRADTYHTKLKQEIHDDSSYSSDSNIEMYNPSPNALTVDLSNNVSGNESDSNLSPLVVMPETELLPNICQQCEIYFDSVEELEIHCRSVHVLKNKVCPICTADFKSVQAYLVHKNKMHAIGYQCSQCLRTFSFKHALINHKRFSCAPFITEMTHACKHCKKRYRNRFKLNEHTKTCTSKIMKQKRNDEIRQKPKLPIITVPKSEVKNTLACHLCGSQFSKRFNLVSSRSGFHIPGHDKTSLLITYFTLIFSESPYEMSSTKR